VIEDIKYKAYISKFLKRENNPARMLPNKSPTTQYTYFLNQQAKRLIRKQAKTLTSKQAKTPTLPKKGMIFGNIYNSIIFYVFLTKIPILLDDF
jgi:hypothetical protein